MAALDTAPVLSKPTKMKRAKKKNQPFIVDEIDIRRADKMILSDRYEVRHHKEESPALGGLCVRACSSLNRCTS